MAAAIFQPIKQQEATMVNAVPQSTSADLDLAQQVVSLLVQRQMPGLRRVAVEVKSGRVTLRGRVASFYEKQLALSCCQRVAGVMSVDDLVHVALPQAAHAG